MGGVSFFREFSLDPYFVRNPGLNYSGAVATPSTVDVYVNGQLLRRVPVPPGQFELKDLPVPAGVADTRLVLRDAFGREQEIGSQYYFTSGLLKEGLYEDHERRAQLLGLCRFASSASDGLRSLKQYVADLQPNQTDIYYLVLDSSELRAINDRYVSARRRYEQLLEGDAQAGHGHAPV